MQQSLVEGILSVATSPATAASAGAKSAVNRRLGSSDNKNQVAQFGLQRGTVGEKLRAGDTKDSPIQSITGCGNAFATTSRWFYDRLTTLMSGQTLCLVREVKENQRS